MMRRLIVLVACLTLPVVALGQTPVPVPNPMASHTPFVILIVGAFLVWAASFSLTTLKQREKRVGVDRKSLTQQRELIFDQLAAAETERTSGALTRKQFDRRTRQLRGKLAAVLAQLESLPKDGRKKR